METNATPTRDVTFTVVDGYLVRTVTGPPGSSRYANRCTKQVFEAVALAVNEARLRGGTSLPRIVRDLNLPHTQVHVALTFLNERSVIDLRGRRWHPATDDVYLDAMVEFFVLDQKTKES